MFVKKSTIIIVLKQHHYYRREGPPVRVAHKSYPLRQALSNHTTEHTCTRANCPISCTNLCLQRNAVYLIICNGLKQLYIGSTTPFIHDRVRELLNNDNSSVKKHILTCYRTINNESIDAKIILHENDPVNLRLFEAFYIRKYKPELNSREECIELRDLLF